MAITNASPYSGFFSTPQSLPAGNQGAAGRIIGFRAQITFASQAAADQIRLFKLPAGILPIVGLINTDTSTGTATIAIGNSGATGKYRTAATFTTTNTPNLFGNQAATGGITPATATEEILATVAVASLPASGQATIDLFCYSL